MRRFLTIRIARAVFGLVAIWCLGCQSFDVFLERLLEDRGETPVLVDASGVAQHDAQEPHSEIEPPNDGCCAHCVAVQAITVVLAAPLREAPETIEAPPGFMVSVVREPLVPPPIRVVA